MLQSKESEIRLQFLEEATENLNTIESAMLKLAATDSIDNQQMDAVLRAAHSIKGGAAMMEFQTLSDLAHRMEDFFKVLKTQQPSIDTELESLLLTAVDHLHRVISLNRQGAVVDKQWLETDVNPVFEQLHQRLGEPTSEHTEDGQDNMVAMIFATNVEQFLQHLESVLAEPVKPYLLEEISTMAKDLGDLGQMLELTAFSNLCASITHHLEVNPERVEEIARLALQAWRRSQAALLVGQVDSLPDQIDLGDLVPRVPDDHAVTNQIAIDKIAAKNCSEQIADFEITSRQTAKNNNRQPGNLKTFQFPIISEPELQKVPAVEFKENKKNAVRVPIKQLTQLSNLFGELTIERSSLDLHIERLRDFVKILQHRISGLQSLDISLEPTNNQVTNIIDNRLEQNKTNSSNGHFAQQGEPSEVPIRKNLPSNSSLLYSSFPDLLPENVIEAIIRIQEVTDDIDLSLEDTKQTFNELNRTAKQLQTTITQVQMRPFSDLVGRFPRAVRELSLQYGKNVELKIHGGETLIDRTILESLSDPLMHLLRNAFEHGIEDAAIRQALGKPEQGVIEIKAVTHVNQTLISVSDDGGGIDLDKIPSPAQHLGFSPLIATTDEQLLALIFEPGFSTAGQVTALSGRGVGLDIVRTNLRQIRGSIKVDTRLRVGTTFTLSVPLTLSIARVLLVESNRMLLAFPADVIEEMLLLNSEQILTTTNKEVFSWDGTMVSLIRLGHWLKFRCPQVAVDNDAMPMMSAPTVLMIAQGNELVGLQIDRFWGEQEVAIRQVEGTIAMPSGFTGCTILGDGRVVPLVNAPELLHWIASCKQSYSLEEEDKSPTTAVVQSQKDTILVVDDSINVRRFLSLTLEKAGYRVEQAKDGQDALEKLLSGLQLRAVICDIDMPRLDGYALLARVKSDPAFKHLPIIMITAHQGDQRRQLAMQVGAAAYFTKPFDELELIKTIKTFFIKSN